MNATPKAITDAVADKLFDLLHADWPGPDPELRAASHGLRYWIEPISKVKT